MLPERLAEVEARIARALERAGRRRDRLTLVAVTKTLRADCLCQAYDAGLRHFGENYVQEFETKAPAAAALEGARFHLIGHLQSNKSRRAAELFDVVETLDSPRLARRLSEAAGRPLEVMIEVKLSPEEAKRGASPQDLPALVDAVAALPNLRLTGLMTMPPWSEDPERSRPYFRRLRELAGQFHLPQLSMGMSADFEVALEEGATEIRLGTALFGPREPA